MVAGYMVASRYGDMVTIYGDMDYGGHIYGDMVARYMVIWSPDLVIWWPDMVAGYMVTIYGSMVIWLPVMVICWWPDMVRYVVTIYGGMVVW